MQHEKLKKIGYGAAILGVAVLIFMGGFMSRGKIKVDCSAQDKLIDEMQNRIQKDSNLILIFKQSTLESSKKASEIINEYEKRIKSLNNTIDLLKKSNISLQEGLKELQSRGAKIDSLKFNKNQLHEFFKNY